MSLLLRAEEALKSHFDSAVGFGAPPRLQAAMRHAVFSGGQEFVPSFAWPWPRRVAMTHLSSPMQQL
jgi:hypothetical protein